MEQRHAGRIHARPQRRVLASPGPARDAGLRGRADVRGGDRDGRVPAGENDSPDGCDAPGGADHHRDRGGGLAAGDARAGAAVPAHSGRRWAGRPGAVADPTSVDRDGRSGGGGTGKGARSASRPRSRKRLRGTTPTGGVSMKPKEEGVVLKATELKRVIRQIEKIKAIQVEMEKRKAELLRELG